MLQIAGQSPSEGEKFVLLRPIIDFSIIDDGTGIDINSLKVLINGNVAVDSLEFKDGFDGTESSITPSDENYLIAIGVENNFKQGELVSVKIQVQNLNGKFLNYNYVFKTIPSEPILKLSSYKDLEVIKSEKIIFLHFEDTIDDISIESINIKIDEVPVITGGVIEDDYNGFGSEVLKVNDGVYIRIDKKESIRNGSYQLSYSVEDLSGNKLLGFLNFKIDLNKAILSSVFPQSGFLSGKGGIDRVISYGDGSRMTIEWHKPVSRSYRADSYVLLYESVSRLEVFDAQPKYLATGDAQATTIGGYKTGVTMSFAARSLETYRSAINPEGMVEVAEGIYSIPDEIDIVGVVDSNDNVITVNSTVGFPSSGVLIINNSEVVRYISKTNTSFILLQGGRGLNNTSAEVHISGDKVRMFLECQDSNTAIVMATPHYDSNTQSGREIKNTGLVVTDYTDNDRKHFQGFDFCGYHRAMPQNTLSGKDDCGSYLGGEFNGQRGMNLFDRMLNREEVLLDQTGEPVILLRRNWDGEKCSCSTSRRNHPKVKGCKKCFGTGYLGGYSQHLNRRREDLRTMVQFGDTKEDLKLGPHQHLEQDYEPQCWTLPTPAIRDRDLIIRFDYNDDIEYFYEVLSTTKDKLFFRHYTRQRLSLKRLDKTDIVYTFKYTFS
jgi:hypothetical protein